MYALQIREAFQVLGKWQCSSAASVGEPGGGSAAKMADVKEAMAESVAEAKKVNQ